MPERKLNRLMTSHLIGPLSHQSAPLSGIYGSLLVAGVCVPARRERCFPDIVDLFREAVYATS